ncbi:unnamed protein product [Didymodactylos carnosus]|uniref:Uncharacterized protein n=1 Tax=Didymodactylos carnosus TaxID=1234261 RepID=A0A814DR38_9BILA|nr:unnamed protein product [Didymodactylos carnosus]CAF1301647.1 unnamed protein product [Didymodactylos carnosus]CAF3731190.1 unnamed protein product [Didymodactylos carnosus]CAF4108020.1 unnamed protein product [Didymodactylos carnosus]
MFTYEYKRKDSRTLVLICDQITSRLYGKNIYYPAVNRFIQKDMKDFVIKGQSGATLSTNSQYRRYKLGQKSDGAIELKVDSFKSEKEGWKLYTVPDKKHEVQLVVGTVIKELDDTGFLPSAQKCYDLLNNNDKTCFDISESHTKKIRNLLFDYIKIVKKTDSVNKDSDQKRDVENDPPSQNEDDDDDADSRQIPIDRKKKEPLSNNATRRSTTKQKSDEQKMIRPPLKQDIQQPVNIRSTNDQLVKPKVSRELLALQTWF